MFIQNIAKSSFFGVIALFPGWICLFGRRILLQQCAEWYADQYFSLLLHYGFSTEVAIINCVLPSSAFAYHACFLEYIVSVSEKERQI